MRRMRASWPSMLAWLIASSSAWALQAAAPSHMQAASQSADSAAAAKRDAARCAGRADIEACYDAIRWNPGDPELLLALGDALLRANRPADAIRNYQRAATIAPHMRGLAAKISAAESKLPAKRAPVNSAAERDSAAGAAVKHYSNAAPEAQSH